MKYIIILIFSFFLISCSSSKTVYWCGDHACINKKEKEAYFKKTMIVEVKEINKKRNKDISDIDLIKKRAGIEDDSELNNIKSTSTESFTEESRDEKRKRIKKQKELAKQARLDEKRRIKYEKELAKQARLEEKKRLKNEKKLAKKTRSEKKKYPKKEKIKIADKNVTLTNSGDDFNKLVEKVIRRNKSKSFPDINNIPD